MISLHFLLLSYVQGSRAGMFLTFLSFCFRNDDTPFLYLHMEHSDRHGWEDVVNRRDDRDSILYSGQGRAGHNRGYVDFQWDTHVRWFVQSTCIVV